MKKVWGHQKQLQKPNFSGPFIKPNKLFGLSLCFDKAIRLQVPVPRCDVQRRPSPAQGDGQTGATLPVVGESEVFVPRGGKLGKLRAKGGKMW